MEMQITYLSIQRLTGVIGLPNGTDCELLTSHNPEVSAFLTMNREPYFLHLRRCTAFSAMILKTLFTDTAGPRSAPEQFATALSSATIFEGKDGDCPLLIVESLGLADSPALERLYDVNACCFGLRLFDVSSIADAAKSAVEAAISGLAMAFSQRQTLNVKALGVVRYAIEADTGRILYSLESTGSALLGRSTSVDKAVFTEAAEITQKLFKDDGSETVARLLARSLQITDNLEAFLTAWAGLEIFLDKAFESYKSKIYVRLKDGVAPAAGPFVDRLQQVMEKHSRYNVRDKFMVVSLFLNEAEAGDDLTLLRSIKEARDSIHVMKLRPHGFPTSETQRLLRKYFRLYLSASASSG